MGTGTAMWQPQSYVLHVDSETHATICQRCKRPTGHPNPLRWCTKCRMFQHQQGQARGLERSLKTRRLKAWLKTFPYS